MTAPLVWVGAPGGAAWRQRPLRLAFETSCIFRSTVQSALDAHDIPWEMAVESRQTRAIEASVSADLAVHAAIDGALPNYMEVIRHGGALPTLPHVHINMYVAKGANEVLASRLASFARAAYSRTGMPALAAE